ncbi:exodeoxyribonuclease III [Marinicella sp. W31]|uniref:exodeoxyribonuclease III n=1 Tax=Marinicella sp. W31 TaxID=3023713 RepID=UPI003757FF6C
MKIASWNVNSLKVRLQHVLQWLEQEQPDVLALQETKTEDSQFPLEAFTESGWEVVFSGQKTYNGVAIIAKSLPQDVVTDIPDLDDPQRRIQAATVDDVRIINLYVVNGEAPGSEKFAYKMDWLQKVTAFIESQIETYGDVVVLGDFNIAPDERDVHDPVKWKDKILCTNEERNCLNEILDLGLQDTFRLMHDDADHFSWWDYRMNGFVRGYGLRIDLVLATEELSETLAAAWIDKTPRGWERPSDHTPVIAEFDW